MSIQSIIETKLTNQLDLTYLEVVNESHNHHVPAGAESHFKVVLVSSEFAGLRLLQRHQWVHEILVDELLSSIHALAIHTYTPSEWQAKHQGVPASPPCAQT